MEVEDDAECRRKLDEQRKKLQKELREVERLSCASKEVQENLVGSLQHQLQEVEKKRNDLMPEHQRVQKRSRKMQSNQDKRKICRKRAWRQEKKCGKSEKKLCVWKEERFTLLSDNVDKNTMADAEMEAELQGLQAGEERRGSNASQTGDSCMEASWQQIAAVCAAVGPNQVGALANDVFQRFKESGAVQELMPGRDERRSEDEQEQGRASQRVALPTPGVVNQVAPASSLELDLPRVRRCRKSRQERSIQVARTTFWR